MNFWHAVYTKAQLEVWAAKNLEERGFEVYLPRYLKERRHARRVDIVPHPLFPRYLFVSADSKSGQHSSVNTAPGVSELVCLGRSPAVLEDQIIKEIRSREGDDGYIKLEQDKRFSKGDPIEIKNGALSRCLGLFECTADKDRVIVLLDVLGRQARVQLSLDQLGSREH